MRWGVLFFCFNQYLADDSLCAGCLSNKIIGCNIKLLLSDCFKLATRWQCLCRGKENHHHYLTILLAAQEW